MGSATSGVMARPILLLLMSSHVIPKSRAIFRFCVSRLPALPSQSNLDSVGKVRGAECRRRYGLVDGGTHRTVLEGCALGYRVTAGVDNATASIPLIWSRVMAIRSPLTQPSSWAWRWEERSTSDVWRIRKLNSALIAAEITTIPR
jgi:hypothetical protein